MAEEKKYLIENIYQGGYSTFKPYATAGYFPTGTLAETTNPRSANILKEFSDKLASGTKKIEVEMLSPDVFDSVPKQYFKEVHRLAKLTGSDVSLHGPVVDVAGMSQSGFSEAQRELAERKIAQTMLRSQELKPKGGVTVNFHSAEGIPGSEFLPPSKRKEGEEYKRIIAVEKSTGRLIPLEREELYVPVREKIKEGEGGKKEIVYEEFAGKPKVMTPEKRIDNLNKTEWDNSIDQLIFTKERADELLKKDEILIRHLLDDLKNKRISAETMEKFPEQKQAWNHLQIINSYLEDVHAKISNKFSDAYKYGDEEQKKALIKISEEFKKVLEKDHSPFGQSRAMQDLMLTLKSPALTPKLYAPIENFALEKSSKTFGNAAFESYKKFRDKTPILVIENPPAGFALSTGEDLKNIVEASRKKFVERAVQDLKMSEKEAESAANKIIGATIDVGHMNMLKKYGYSDKEIVKEIEKMAPYIKHIHLSDNFGMEHTELPVGMGNVPIKAIIEQLKRKGVDVEGITKVVELNQVAREAGFTNIYTTLEEMGSPIYSTRVAPYWNQRLGFHQDYFSGMGLMLPQVNYETFGAGFSTLPHELGGQKPGGQGSRLSGNRME